MINITHFILIKDDINIDMIIDLDKIYSICVQEEEGDIFIVYDADTMVFREKVDSVQDGIIKMNKILGGLV